MKPRRHIDVQRRCDRQRQSLTWRGDEQRRLDLGPDLGRLTNLSLIRIQIGSTSPEFMQIKKLYYFFTLWSIEVHEEPSVQERRKWQRLTWNVLIGDHRHYEGRCLKHDEYCKTISKIWKNESAKPIISSPRALVAFAFKSKRLRLHQRARTED